MKDGKALLEEIAGKQKGQDVNPKEVNKMKEKTKASQSSEQYLSQQVLEVLFSN